MRSAAGPCGPGGQRLVLDEAGGLARQVGALVVEAVLAGHRRAGEPGQQRRLGAGAELVRRRRRRVALEQPGARLAVAHPLVEERVGAPVAVLLRLRDARLHEREQAVGAVGIETGAGGPALPLLVGLVLVVAREAAQQQLGEDQARRRRSLDPVGAVLGAADALDRVVRIVAAAGIASADHHPDEQRLAEHAEQRLALLHLGVVVEHHVADLVPQQAGQHVVVEAQLEHAAGDEDVTAGQGEGVRLRHVDGVEAEREVDEARLLGQPVADAVDPRQLHRVVVGAVLVDGAPRHLQALLEQLRVLDHRHRGGGDGLGGGGPEDHDEGGEEGEADGAAHHGRLPAGMAGCGRLAERPL